MNKGRCVSCHVIEQTRRCSPTIASTTSASASIASRTTCRTFAPRVPEGQGDARRRRQDRARRTRRRSELGRFAVTEHARRHRRLQDLDAAQRRGDRALHARRQHQDAARRGGALQQRRDHEGRRSRERFPERRHSPADLTEHEINDLVAFLETLTSPQFAAQKQAVSIRRPAT